jgi:hypothetical protein
MLPGMLKLIYLSFLLISTLTFAKNIPFNQEFSQKVESTFFENHVISAPKVNLYIQKLLKKRAELTVVLGNQMRLAGEKDSAKISKEVSEHKFITALNIAVEKLQQINSENAWENIYAALDLEGAIRIEGPINAFSGMIRDARNFFKTWIVKKNALPQEEASNLYDPLKKDFLSTQDIQVLKASQKDLSVYDPDPRTTFWDKPKNISQIKMRDAAMGKTVRMYDDVKVKFPEVPVFYYDEVKHSDTKPKVDVYSKDADGKKEKYKLKFGGEIYADPTLAAITMALGFPADVTKHEKFIKLIFPKKKSVSEFKRDWEVYYKREGAYRIEKYIKETGKTAEGLDYIVFSEGLIEAKPKKLIRLGGWAFGDNGNNATREVRGLSFIQMWLDNTDLKEFENNRLILKKTPQGYERFHIISDLGHALGSIYTEIPELYSSTMVGSQNAKEIGIRYRAFRPVAIKDTVTYDDARWAIRLIASLTRTQLEDVMDLAQWPKCIGEIYVEKMLMRRNDLVTNFDLEDEFSLIPTSDDVKFENKCDVQELKNDYSTNFDFDLGFMAKPAVQAALRGLMDLARGGISGSNRLTLSHAELELQTSFISQIILNVKRDIEKNINPTSDSDLYLVKDHLEVGLRLGPAYGAFVDVIYTRSFTLSYPVRSLDEARLHNGFIVNALLPLDVRNGKLPEKYVLRTEHYFETGVGVEGDVPESPVSVTIRAKGSRVALLRSYVDHKDPKRIVLYREQAKSWKASLQTFLRVLGLRIPVMTTLNNWGKSYGVGSVITPNLENELVKASVNGDFSALQGKEEEFQVENSFKENLFKWSLIFWKGGKDERLDRVNFYSGKKSTEKLQFKTHSENKWSFLGKSEANDVSVEVFNDLSKAENYQLRLSVSNFDASTRDVEMQDNYLYFINGLSPDGVPLIPLSMSLGYSTNGKWGRTVTQSTNTYYPEAMAKLLDLNEEDYWEALAAVCQKTNMEFFGIRNSYMLAQRDEKSRSLISEEHYDVIDRSQDVLKRLRKMKLVTEPESRIQELGRMFKKMPFKKNGFFEGKILGAINRLVKQDNYYSHNTISAPLFEEINIVDEAPLFGFSGKDRKKEFEFLTYNPDTPSELYFMFDQWL